MFSHLQAAPDDPILGLMAQFRQDPRAGKIDLGVGVYRDEAGRTPILDCVREAERLRFAEEDSKSYQGMAGDPAFTAAMEALALGEHLVRRDQRVFTAQTPGGTGALRVAAGLIRFSRPDACLWLPDASWGNHASVFQAAGLRLREYPYYDPQSQCLRADALLATLAQVPSGDVVLLHACCHNPSGVDIPAGLWPQIAALAQRQGFVPLLDMAYQGFAEGLDRDAVGVRTLAAALPELLLCTSCSKNFGLYRERIGALSLIADTAGAAAAAGSVMLGQIRNFYSMPPAHGAAIVARILSRPTLTAQWQGELTAMRERLRCMRALAVSQLAATGLQRDFGFIQRQSGLFSFLGISPGQIDRLRSEFAIYLLGSSRMNIAGLSEANIGYFADSLAAVLRE